jgi:protein-L-isoaspartate(D-aspartate) O-methyltransferase
MRKVVVLAALLSACGSKPAAAPAHDATGYASPVAAPPAESEPDFATLRARMVETQIAARGIRDERVLAAMRKVPRHEFVPAGMARHAYEDHALAIGEDQTISQPYIVAVMTELAEVEPRSRVLEIGTGSGYQAAVLAEIAADVYSIEIVEPLARRAAATLQRLGYGRVHLRIGDGYKGWPEAAPFDAILVTAAPPKVPVPLKQQLKVGGRLVVPVGGQNDAQLLTLIRRVDEEHWQEQRVEPVSFVPMTGEAQQPR